MDLNQSMKAFLRKSLAPRSFDGRECIYKNFLDSVIGQYSCGVYRACGATTDPFVELVAVGAESWCEFLCRSRVVITATFSSPLVGAKIAFKNKDEICRISNQINVIGPGNYGAPQDDLSRILS